MKARVNVSVDVHTWTNGNFHACVARANKGATKQLRRNRCERKKKDEN